MMILAQTILISGMAISLAILCVPIIQDAFTDAWCIFKHKDEE